MDLLLTFLALTLLYALSGVWAYLRKARKSQLMRRISVALLLLFLVTLEPIQYLTEYSVSLSFGPVLILALSLGACLVEEILVWRESRVFGLAGIPGLVAALALFVALFFTSGSIFDPAGRGSLSPLMSGRLSPTLSYRVLPTEGGFGAHYYAIEEYTNPSRFPIVQTRIASGVLPCGGTEEDLRSHRVVPSIGLGPNANTLHVVCVYQDSAIPTSSEDVRLLIWK